MRKLWIFNPENDMALADGTPGYTPPESIRRFRQERWTFPREWAAADDLIWDGASSLIDLPQDVEIAPWGWSPALVHQLTKAGISPQRLPSADYLQTLRQVSSRCSTVPVQQELGISARTCRTLEEVLECLTLWGDCFVKAPWSSSGKGVMKVSKSPTIPDTSNRIQKMLRLQGMVVVEKALDGTQDFAMEFHLDGKGHCRYIGLSIFQTDAYGHYLSNLHATEEKKMCRLLQYVRQADLTHTRQFFQKRLITLFPQYHGPVGVDMLALKDGSMCPCIEINWRMTMGYVSCLRHSD